MLTTSAFVEKKKPNYGSYANSLSDDIFSGIESASSLPTGIAKPKTELQTSSGSNMVWDKDTLAGAAGLGSVLLQAVALPDQLKMARTQRRALEQNMATARQEQDRRNKNISSFNSVRSSQPTSAFAQ